MERNSLIPWRYSRWNATFMGIVFMGFGIAMFVKDNSQFHFYQIIFFVFGLGYIAYAWSNLYERFRKKRGYYQDTNPPLLYNIFQMMGQIIGFIGLLSFTFIDRGIALFLVLGGLMLIAVGAGSLFLGKAKK